MKKKVVFVLINMNIGGTEKALLNMISAMPRDEYDITVLLLEASGGFLQMIPKDVRVEYLYGFTKHKELLQQPLHRLIKEAIKSHHWIKAMKLLRILIQVKVTRNSKWLFKYMLRNYQAAKQPYDIAVAYAGPMDFITHLVAHKLNAKKKIQWIHFDVTKVGYNRKFVAETYPLFDKVFVVSDEARSKLVSDLPQIKPITEVFRNLISPETIIEQSVTERGFQDGYKGIRIVTVGRLSQEKGQDMAIRVCARLFSEGYRFRWYCIGEGPSREEYEKLIKQLHIENQFVLLGAKSNPYPYMKQADIYVQSSRYEGYCVTLLEAKCLNKPIVTTKVNGTEEQFVDGVTGIIADISEDAIYQAVRRLMDDEILRYRLAHNLSKENNNSNFEIRKFAE